jgi:enterobactin synthetase component D / holo-[acyl-carrier protein] synthase
VLTNIAFDLRLVHGRCVGVRLPDGVGIFDALAETALAPEERTFAASLTAVRRRTWVGGRVAMREALTRSGFDAPAVLADSRGAPLLPAGVAGSISHKESLAVALVARGAPDDGERLGVDLELDAARPHDIASHVLTDEEATELAALAGPARAREVLLRFSAKESIYKALDPFVRRYVAFKEIAVRPLPGGAAEVQLHLPASEGPFKIEVQWLRWQGLVLTTARAARG